MKTDRPTRNEIAALVERLTTLRDTLRGEGSIFRANTIQQAIDMLDRLTPPKPDGDGHA